MLGTQAVTKTFLSVGATQIKGAAPRKMNMQIILRNWPRGGGGGEIVSHHMAA